MKQRKSGRPLKTDEPLKTYSFSLSESQIALLDGWAKAKGESRSAVLRSLVMRLEVAPVVEAKPMRLVETTAPVEAAQDIAVATTAVDAIAEAMNAPAATPEIVTPAEPTVAERIAAALASLDR